MSCWQYCHENPATLQRALCLWEIYCTIEAKSKFEIALNEGQREQFFQEIFSSDDAGKVVDEMLGAINSEKRKNFKDGDRDKIFAMVRA